MAKKISKETIEEIQKKFIFGIIVDDKLKFPSCRELAREYSINHVNLQKKINENGWEFQKEKFINKNAELIQTNKQKLVETNKQTLEAYKPLKQEIIDSESEKFSKSVSDFDFQISESAKEIVSLVKSNIKVLKTVKKDEDDYVNPFDLEYNSKVLERAQKIFKVAIGEALPNENNNIQINIIRVDKNVESN